MEPIVKLRPEEFSKRFLEIPDPPKELYARGYVPLEGQKILAVVGSRKHTMYGKDNVRALIHALRGLPVVIVSGLAYGIDAIAHQAALEAKLPTIAFPGSGLNEDVLYPAQHKLLAREIVKEGGMLISEFKPDMRAANWSFPQRNRLMAALSHAVLVVEAEQKSGTLITSRLASEYNRDVLTIPGPINSPTSKGPNMLIRLGATPITCADDLREALGFPRSDEETPSIPSSERTDLTPDEKRLMSFLREPKSRDELIRELSMSAAEFNMTLTMLEIKGVITEELGQVRRV